MKGLSTSTFSCIHAGAHVGACAGFSIGGGAALAALAFFTREEGGVHREILGSIGIAMLVGGVAAIIGHHFDPAS